ncbi:aminoacyl-histidine dipeptidase [Thermohalobacter berrensis]|uniref:Cytosol non-specific dipeptidase n=1 Tax=Thermohalobacter berrensis TaxID=99594 RepID=A0A419T2C4_9FIRM|nr:aminoacyl-histidine dipeptidase [Thermohalobacter berrensis]RKD31568.1 aminoacyl-histidine dipeptidase [Thermohalobacter berrensis]
MANILGNIKPKKVFQYFEEISKIPRGSGNEKEISNYLVDFAKKHDLEVIQDEALNIIIKKPGTKGYENAPTVIIQGHMDMVCEKEKDIQHDFEKDPIKLKVDGDFVSASGTTLGADNGIAVAYCMAILASDDIQHPPLEVLITTEEETGMGGASKLNPEYLSGRILINIDSEEEGTLLVSCAGGIRVKIKLPIKWQEVNDNFDTYNIKIKGLKGGHSGMEIDKGRGSANKLIGRILDDLNSEIEYSLVDINGGAKMNAIPREAEATILVSPEDKMKLEDKIEYWNNTFKNELKSSDPDIMIKLEKSNKKVDKVFSNDTVDKVISLLALIPNGVQTMSQEIEGLVQSSTNLGVITTTEDEVSFDSAVRSSVRSLKEEIVRRMELAAKVVGANIVKQGDYPAWEYREDSYIRDIFVKVYEKLYNKKPEVTAIHAGLECGLLGEKIKDVDMISFGPNMYDVHTPNEHLSISSTKRTWEYLLEVLKEIK